jgi:HTH-type transcriptional regulator / antitoxin HigA
MTPETAVALAAAFGNTGNDWMRMDAAYRLALTDADVSGVQKRARLYDLAPIRDMQRRGWIKQTKDIGELQTDLEQFFGTSSLDQKIAFAVSAFRAETFGHLNSAERAWCFRALQLAAALPSEERFHDSSLRLAERDLRGLAAFPQTAARIPRLLSKFGIRLVVVEPLAGSRIDGAAFWLDATAPVIAITIRYDRIDRFWFILFHELAHIRNHDQPSVDLDLVGDKADTTVLLQEEHERRASEEAAANLIPPNELTSFIRRVGPLYSRARIVQFAHRMKIHPGIIVGQLQHRGEIKFSSHQQLLAKVRDGVTAKALTDGWGKTISLGVT